MTKQTASNNPVLKVVKTMVTAADFKEAAKVFNEADEANRITALVDQLEGVVAMSREELLLALEEVAVNEQAEVVEVEEQDKAAKALAAKEAKAAAAAAKKAQRETDHRLAQKAKLEAKVKRDEARAAKKAAAAAAKAAKAAEPKAPKAAPVGQTEDGEKLYPIRIDLVIANVTEEYLAGVDAKAVALGFKNFRDYARRQLDFVFDKLDDDFSNR